jgi:alkylation response protein AidB-like acyl-CoA dehydrogenase
MQRGLLDAPGVVCLVEGGTMDRSPAQNERVRATTRAGDDYVLDGTKCFITNAPVADLFLVYASTNPERRFLGVSAFLVPKGTPGLTVTPEDHKTGPRLMGLP